MNLGLDLDNTLICYDRAFHARAVELGLIIADTPAAKAAVRRAVREAHGDGAWTRLQGEVYGPRIGLARPFPGALEFLAACRERGVRVRVVSHKTSRAAAGPADVDLRAAALGWLEGNGFFADSRLAPDQVAFTDTRAEKLDRIRAEGFTHFVDDLEELFAEPEFPAGVGKLLFAPNGEGTSLPGVGVVRSFHELGSRLLAA
jgi:hypothetical protein